MFRCSGFPGSTTCPLKSESVFSDCQQIVKKVCFVVFCAEVLQQFSTNVRQKATNIMRVSFIVKVYTVKIK